MLELSSYEPTTPLELTPPEQKKSPLVAFLLSLIWPGVGHLYLGEIKKAVWLILMHLLASLLAIFGGNFAVQGWLMLPSLFAFGVCDAYFSAREWNAGASDRLIGNNPRIALLLNFLTKGFGYFYLGDRAKGVIWFVGITVLQAALAIFQKPLLILFAFAIQAAIAVDGYLVARRRLLEINPELQGDAVARFNPGGLPPAVPLAVSVLGFLGTIAVFALAVTLNGKSIEHHGSFETTEDGLHFHDDAEKVSFTVPEDWQSWKVKGALAGATNGTCNLILLEQFSFSTPMSVRDGVVSDLKSRHPDALVHQDTKTVAGRPAPSVVAAFQGPKSVPLEQTYVIVQRGFKFFTLIETRPQGMECAEELQAAENSLKL